jgi:AcrR family transcriptional regulator
MPELKPRKVPRQARSIATCGAILEACARLLKTGHYADVTTNHIAERAGVGIGTLYEFFPNKEAIVAALAERHLTRLIAEVTEGLEVALGLDDWDAAQFLIRRVVAAVSRDRELYQVLIREAPFLQRLAATKQATAAAFELARSAAERAQRRINLPHLQADSWLISRMVYNAVLEIAFLREGTMDRDLLTEELVRLTFRMIQGRDPVRRRRGRTTA